jgi:hypothetical protein
LKLAHAAHVMRFHVIVMIVSALTRVLAAGAELIVNKSADNAKYLICLVPFQASFQLMSG